MTAFEHFKLYGQGIGPAPKTRQEVVSYLKGLSEAMTEHLNQVVRRLSCGGRQILVLALQLLKSPSLLLLDEHTAALDPKMSKHVMALTQRIIKQRGISALMISHQDNHQTYVDRVLEMRGGCLGHYDGKVCSISEKRQLHSA